MSSNLTISLIMPTYNRASIIEIAIKSIIKQKKYNSKLELIIGDDGSDLTEKVVNKYLNSPIKIIYQKFERIPLSDKINKLIKLSSGEFYGIVGSDDIQSPYKISAFEKSLNNFPNAQVFGQKKFIYHDIIYQNSTLWTQNRNLDFFKAGSFVIINRKIFDKINGYESGLWRKIDNSFYEKIKHLGIKIVDVESSTPDVIYSSIALQHIDNIWNRNKKGLNTNKSVQLASFYSQPIKLNLEKIIPELFEDYKQVRKEIICQYKKQYPIKYFIRKFLKL